MNEQKQDAQLVSIDTKSQHIVIQTQSGDTHVIPISVFRHIVSGKLTVNKISEFIPIYQEITREWLKLKGL